MSIALCIYLLMGPLAWFGVFALHGVGRARMDRMRRAVPLGEPPPHVSILIPAKDEVDGIERCVRQTLAQDYPNFDLLVIDDRSTDGSGPLLDRLAAEDGRLSVLHIDQLPQGWLGKCHALARGVERVASVECSPWILFVDSDVTLRPEALRVALSNALERKYDAVSLLTKLECHSFAERLVLPLAGAAWSFMFTVAQTNDDDLKTNATANGQFFLIRRSAYDAVGGHAAVRDQITEDVELMRRLKMNDYRVRLCFGDHLATTRMHATFKQMLHGWGRIFSGTAQRRPAPILAGIVFLLISGLSVWPALAYGISHSPLWVGAAALHWALMTAYAVLVYGRTGQPRVNALLFPLGQCVLLVLFGYALRMCRTGRVFWRDTHYASWTPAANLTPAVSENVSSPASAGVSAGVSAGAPVGASGGNSAPIAARSLPVPGTIPSDDDCRSAAPTPSE